jgi:hypothetical protein
MANLDEPPLLDLPRNGLPIYARTYKDRYARGRLRELTQPGPFCTC